MTHPTRGTSAPTGTVHLAASQPGRFQITAARAAFTDLEWLGDPVEAGSLDGGWQRIKVVLVLPVTDGSSPGPIRKGALLDVGPLQQTDDWIRLGIAWQSDSIAPLFPIFAGHLVVRPDGLSLEGEYEPPFGRLGLLIDAGLLHFVARRTAHALLVHIAAHLDG